MLSSDALSTLCCPVCKESFTANNHVYRCKSCDYQLETWGETPWLFSNPYRVRGEWKNRYEYTLAHYESMAQGIHDSLEKKQLRTSTQKRLRRHVQALGEQRKTLMKVLSPLDMQNAKQRGVYQAGSTSLPESQPLMGYYHNILRDWAWGEQENEQSARLVLDLIDGQFMAEKWLVLGAGAGRLAYDLHQKKQGLTIATDLNPFLLWVSKKMTSYQSMSLKEFPLSPKKLDDAAQSWKCRAPARSREGLSFILHNAFEPGFKDESFQVVLTPWFLDIVHEDLLDSAIMVNRLLPEGGVWLNLGSMAFFHEDKAKCYSRQEVIEVIQEAGFEVLKTLEKDIPYMNSPSSCQKRYENVFSFAARKLKTIKSQPKESLDPVWLQDIQKPIERLSAFEEVGLSQKFVAQILGCIDGKKSIFDLAGLLAEDSGLEQQQCIDLVAQMVRQVYVNHLKDQNFR
ncbi:MAG: hypothetical protein AB8C84_04635 [Oligoflexales bacterium]